MAQAKKRAARAAARSDAWDTSDVTAEIEKAQAALGKAAASANELSLSAGVEPLAVRHSKDIARALRLATRALEKARSLLLF